MSEGISHVMTAIIALIVGCGMGIWAVYEAEEVSANQLSRQSYEIVEYVEVSDPLGCEQTTEPTTTESTKQLYNHQDPIIRIN